MQKTIIMLLVATLVLLIGVCMAEPQPVDGGWHRSDEVPVETPIETPTAASPDGEQHSAADGEQQAPAGIDAEAAATIASEPQPGDDVIESEAAEQRGDMTWYVISWVVFICMGLAMVWIALTLRRGGRAKR